MKKLKLGKLIPSVLVIFLALMLVPTGANAEWKQDYNGWWYAEGNSYAKDWRIIDGYWYYFYQNGYMAKDITIDGYYLNSNGAWTNSALGKEEFDNIVSDIMLQLVNEHRQANNVVPLTKANDLMITAKGKSQHMANNNYFDHSYNGTDCFALAKQLYNTDISGENIIYTSETFSENGYSTEGAKNLAYELFAMWKNSPDHDENMLRSSFTEFGFGIEYGNYNGCYVVFGTQHFR